MANSPHDALFRYTFTQPEHAAALLRALLPAEVAAGLAWHTLAVLPGTRLDRNLRRHQTDLLFAVQGRTGACLVQVIVEHSSRVDAWMALRALDYAVGVCRQLVREGAVPGSLPPVFVVVVHHGRQAWTAATRFGDLIAAAHRDASGAAQFACSVQSLAAMSADEIDGLALTVLGKLTLAFLQFVPGAGQHELAAAFRRWGGLVRGLLLAPSGIEAMQALSEYVLLTTCLPQQTLIEVVRDEMNEDASEIMETTGMRLIRQGRLQGLQEGRAEGRGEGRVTGQRELMLGLLQQRFGALPSAGRDRVLAADADQLDRWARRLFDAVTLDELFD